MPSQNKHTPFKSKNEKQKHSILNRDDYKLGEANTTQTNKDEE